MKKKVGDLICMYLRFRYSSKSGGLFGNIRYFLGTTNMGSTIYYFQVYSWGRSLFLNFVASGDATQKPLFKIDENIILSAVSYMHGGINFEQKKVNHFRETSKG